MKQLFYYLAFTFLGAAALGMMFSYCSRKKVCHYGSPEEAIADCRHELYRLKSLKTVDIDDLYDIMAVWDMKRDTISNMLEREKDTARFETLVHGFFSLSDSVQDEIHRLAYSNKRSIEEILYLQLKDDTRRTEITKSTLYKSIESFYNSLDNVVVDSKKEGVVEEYSKLFKETDKIRVEADFMDFLSKEDYCFRWLLGKLTEVSTEQLVELTQLTEGFLNSFVSSVRNQSPKNQIERIEMLLLMRLNRRVIQNAITCRDIVYMGRKLTQEQANCFRWMIMQPFLSIGRREADLLTPLQIKELKLLAMESPKLMKRLNRLGNLALDKQTEEKLMNTVADFYLELCLNGYIYGSLMN